MGTGISGMLSDAAAVDCQIKKKNQQKRVTHIYLTNLLHMLQYMNPKMFSWCGLHTKNCDIGCDNIATHFVILRHIWGNRYSIPK